MLSKFFGHLLFVFLIIVFVCCDVCAQTSTWFTLSDQQKRDKILYEARRDLGRQFINPPGSQFYYLQCKEWVRRKVSSAGGPNIPSTYSNPGNIYHVAKWNGNPYTSIRWQAWYGNTFIFNFNQVGIQQGHIVQWRFITNGGEHTAIVESITPTSITLLDCNWNNNGTVIRHNLTLQEWLQKVAAWTFYQIN